jgi:hypothetical protein
MNLRTTCLRTLSALAASAALLTTSCKKSNDNTGSTVEMTAAVGPANFQSTINTGGYSQSTGAFQLQGYTIISAGDTTGIQLTFKTPFQLNVPINSVTSSATGVDIEYIDTKTGVIYDGGFLYGHSTLTVTAWDSNNDRIAGTFTALVVNSFTGNDSLTIANGQFNYSYTVQP